MPEETKETKAKKIAAARKKLKEYQSKEKRDHGESSVEKKLLSQENLLEAVSSTTTMSEKSDSEPNLIENDRLVSITSKEMQEKMESLIPAFNSVMLETSINQPDVNPSSSETPMEAGDINTRTESLKIGNNQNETKEPTFESSSSQNMNTIQLLISEKTALSAEINKLRILCKERDLENEELRIQFTMTNKRMGDLQTMFTQQQKSLEEFRHLNANIQNEFAQTKIKCDDQTEHIAELKKNLSLEKSRNQELQQQFQDKSDELELTQVRISQLTDEASFSKDNRVETLTQTQFMYEQQIRDLQAMVQQLSQDKEQANQQYQSYVQHLNNEVSTLSEKNSELSDECSKMQERERGLIEHISELEKEIQKSIIRQEQYRDNINRKNETTTAGNNEKILQLKKTLSEYEHGKREAELKIDSHEKFMEQQNNELIQKQQEINELQEYIQNINSEQPDKIKLLATMESDKIAASRALIQNEDLKKQLEELQLRVVQLINDKADLINRIDSEEFANREMRNNFKSLEEKLQSTDKILHFKDEEMIRLSHENVDLTKKNQNLQQQLDGSKPYETREYFDNNKHDHVHSHNEHDDHDHHEHGAHNHHEHEMHKFSEHQAKECDEQKNVIFGDLKSHPHGTPEHIPTIEAVEKLQQRFTQLIKQVADLTEEKQRLEHLVLQLQGETETIGEYITLYQTQRRILKQREYEKSSQMRQLQIEREQMREKISTLNKLVCSLGAELPNHLRLGDNVSAEPVSDSTDSSSSTPSNDQYSDNLDSLHLDESVINKKLSSNESQQILTKIQNIISEIRDKTSEIPTPGNKVDHFNCCLGKFEVV